MKSTNQPTNHLRLSVENSSIYLHTYPEPKIYAQFWFHWLSVFTAETRISRVKDWSHLAITQKLLELSQSLTGCVRKFQFPPLCWLKMWQTVHESVSQSQSTGYREEAWEKLDRLSLADLRFPLFPFFSLFSISQKLSSLQCRYISWTSPSWRRLSRLVLEGWNKQPVNLDYLNFHFRSPASPSFCQPIPLVGLRVFRPPP